MRPFAACLLAALAALVFTVPPPASGDYCCRRGYYAPSYGYSYAYTPSYYAPSYTPSYNYSYQYEYHGAGWWHGRWYPAGNYYYHPGGYWMLEGYGPHYGYTSPEAYHGHGYAYNGTPYYAPAYYGVQDYYRDATLADSIAYKVLVGRAAIGNFPGREVPDYGRDDPATTPRTVPRRDPAPDPAPTMPPRPPSVDPKPPVMPRAEVSVPVPPALTKHIKESCGQCHVDQKQGNLDLSHPETLTAGTWAAMYSATNTNWMPEGGKNDDATVKLFWEQWQKVRKASKKTSAAAPRPPNPEG